jgi:D-3-phosphoglycerate dehydrogenase
MISILVTDQLNTPIIDKLKEIPEFEIIEIGTHTPDNLKKLIDNVEAIVSDEETILNSQILSQAGRLKLIIQTGGSLNNIDLDYAKSKKIEVRNTPFATAIAVAEYTIAQMLGISRFIGPAYKSMKEHKWEKDLFRHGTELYKKTAGIIGFGRIGQEVAKRLTAFGMKILYFDKRVIETELPVEAVPLEDLLIKSDYVSIHLPFNRETEHIISYSEFALVKNEAVLINVSSAGVVHQDALQAALLNNQLKAVVLDVFEKEPLCSFDLIDNPKVYPAPHLGGQTIERQQRAGIDVVSILKEFFNV